MDDRDLQLLRTFRIDETEPPAGLQARIEERLWRAILAEESAAAAGARRRSGRWAAMLRPAVAAGAALVLVTGVATMSDGGANRGPGSGSASVTQAGGSSVLDSTAAALFGSDAGTNAPVVGRIDLSQGGEALTAGPSHDVSGTLDERSVELIDGLTRDPGGLLDELRDSVAQAGIDDPSDSHAFRIAIDWIADASVPTDLRSSMLRALAGMDGIDDAATGVDVLGRPGIVLGHLDPGSGIRTQVVLDAGTGTLRELRGFTTTYVDPACPPGTFTEHSAYADDGSWIDPRRLPFVDWPQVVSACGALAG